MILDILFLQPTETPINTLKQLTLLPQVVDSKKTMNNLMEKAGNLIKF